jgi:SAM-dependent methyltransferase
MINIFRAKPQSEEYSKAARFEEFQFWKAELEEKYRSIGVETLADYQYRQEYVPDERQISLIQTASKANPLEFYITGYQAALAYFSEVESAGLDLKRLGSVLEMGVGYARILRHFFPLGASCHGCDITHETIEWCNQYLHRHGRFRNTEISQPVPYADNCFDVVFANSVFTHIREKDVQFWIDELHRIVRPGGAVITTHYNLNEHLRHLSGVKVYEELKNNGYIEWGAENVRERHTFYTKEELTHRWGSKFVILGLNSYHRDQDHLVCLKGVS